MPATAIPSPTLIPAAPGTATVPHRRLTALALCTLLLALPAAPVLAQAGAPAAAPVAAPGADPHLARNLAATCANCHGTNGRAQEGGVALAGYPADRLTATMASFKAGTRPATIMHQIAKGYTDAQIALIAGYFAAQKP